MGGCGGGQRSHNFLVTNGSDFIPPFLRPGAPAPPHPGAPGPPRTVVSLRDLQHLWADRGQCHPTTCPPQSTNGVDPPIHPHPFPLCSALVYTPAPAPTLDASASPCADAVGGRREEVSSGPGADSSICIPAPSSANLGKVYSFSVPRFPPP